MRDALTHIGRAPRAQRVGVTEQPRSPADRFGAASTGCGLGGSRGGLALSPASRLRSVR